MCFFFLVACCFYRMVWNVKKIVWIVDALSPSPPLVCTLLNSEEYVLDCWVHSLFSPLISIHHHRLLSSYHTNWLYISFFGTGTIYGVIDKVKPPPPPHYWLLWLSLPLALYCLLWLWDHCCYYKLLSCFLVLFSFHFSLQTRRTQLLFFNQNWEFGPFFLQWRNTKG